jgi:methyl-accepting chemotaxis protein
MPTQLGTALTEPVNQILNKQEIILNDLADSVARLQPMTQELRDTYSSMAQKAAMQNSHSRVLEQTMRHIEQATQNVSSQIREITLTAEESHQTTAAAAQSMLETVASMNDLAEDINLASSEMSVLKDGSDKIHTILEVITSIAEQTNLLALNAAIEAARA